MSILVVPYSLETIDQNRFSADGLARCMIDAFDVLYEESAEQPN